MTLKTNMKLSVFISQFELRHFIGVLLVVLSITALAVQLQSLQDQSAQNLMRLEQEFKRVSAQHRRLLDEESLMAVGSDFAAQGWTAKARGVAEAFVQRHLADLAAQSAVDLRALTPLSDANIQGGVLLLLEGEADMAALTVLLKKIDTNRPGLFIKEAVLRRINSEKRSAQPFVFFSYLYSRPLLLRQSNDCKALSIFRRCISLYLRIAYERCFFMNLKALLYDYRAIEIEDFSPVKSKVEKIEKNDAPITDYAEILMRPLFSTARAPEVIQAADDVVVDSTPDVQAEIVTPLNDALYLRGIINSGDGDLAFIVDAQDQGIWYRENDTVADWIIVGITKTSVRLRRGDKEILLEFFSHE